MNKISSVFRIIIAFLVMLSFVSCTTANQDLSGGISIAEEKAEEKEEETAEEKIEGYPTESDTEVASTELDNEVVSIEEPSFFGVWSIDKVALISKMYTGTTKDGDLEENLFDPADYLGYEIEYSSEFFRLGDEKYVEPEYVLSYTTVEKHQNGGIYRLPSLYGFIIEEGITLDKMNEYENMSDIPLQRFDVKFKADVKYEKYSFIPVGTQCVLLNKDTMLVGVWGKILLARRV